MKPLLLIIPSLLLACDPPKDDDDFVLTGDGYKVTGPVGPHCLDWIDIRINEWITAVPDQVGQDYRKSVAHKYTYQSVMDWRFPTDDSPTGYAVGIHYGAPIYLIGACVYDGGMYSLPTSGIGYAVIPHELDHSIGLHH